MVNLLFSTNGRISRGPFWLVYLILFPVTLALILFIEPSKTCSGNERSGKHTARRRC
jgi:uncharacterized membrane protein YhaH (DUF805 family)